jgi:hypothetical protein
MGGKEQIDNQYQFAAEKKECWSSDTIYAIDIVSVSHDHQKVLPRKNRGFRGASRNSWR